jgi:hypothetical protein
MLEFQLQQFPFRFGLDEGTDPNQQPPGRLTTLENGEWIKGGRIQKRGGVAATYGTTYYADTSTGSITAGKRLLSRGGELCLNDGSYLYSYSSERAAWQRVDRVPDVAMTWTTALDTNVGISSSDAALSASGYLVQAWRAGAPNDSSGRLWYRVTDAETGSILLSPTQLSTVASIGCRVLVSGTIAFVVYRETADIKVRAIDLTTMASATVAVLRNDARLTTGFDAKIVGSNLVLAYENSANALKLYSYSYNSGTNVYTQTANGGVTGEAGNDFRKIAIDGISGERIYVAYYVESTDLIRVATVNDSTLAQVTAPVTQESTASLYAEHVSIVRTGTGGCVVAWSFLQSVTAGPISRVTTCAIDTVCAQTADSLRGTWGTRMLSRLFMQGSRVFIFATDYPAPEFTEYVGVNSYLLEVETTADSGGPYVPHRYVGKLDMFIGGAADYGFLPSAVAVSATDSLVPVPFLSSSPQTVANFRNGLRHVHVTTGASLPADMWRSVEFGGESYIAGALLSGYDGRAVFDYGIARPVIIGAKQNSGPGAGSIAAGAYLYGFVEEWRSNAGILHRSATATATQSSVASGTTVLYVLTSALTRKQAGLSWSEPSTQHVSPQNIAVHRSEADGTSYHRWSYEPTYNAIRKDFLSSSQTITDTRADADIGGTVALSTRPLMYTAGGILDDEQPPNLLTVALHKSRLWGVAGDRRTIWFSKSFQDDLGVAPGFSASFRISADADINALWSIDEKLVLAADNALWFVLGGDAGPAANGQGSDIQGPIRIQTDVGCTNPRSVVTTPDGAMFEHDGRIYLLTRGLEVVWIGRPVQDKLASFPSITSAVIVPKKNQVRFTCNNDAGTAHTVLVYDYVEKQWSTFRYVGGTVAVADAIVHDGEYHFVTTAGTVYRETADAVSLDVDAWVTMTLETAWISAAGPLAFQMVRRFALHGVSNSNHGLTVSVAVDRATSYSPAVAWASGSAVTTVGPLEAAELHLGKKCSSIRFKVVDSSPGGALSDGRGPSFDSMGIEVGIKKGFQKKPATKRG